MFIVIAKVEIRKFSPFMMVRNYTGQWNIRLDFHFDLLTKLYKYLEEIEYSLWFAFLEFKMAHSIKSAA